MIFRRLCIESKLPQGSHVMTNAKDPYEFGESTGGAAKGCGVGVAMGAVTAKLSTVKVRSKAALLPARGRAGEMGWVGSGGGAASRPAGVKRRRTGSSAEAGSSPQPQCLATVSTAPCLTTTSRTLLNDINIVLDGGPGLVNAQLLNIPTMQLAHTKSTKLAEYSTDTLSAIMTALPLVDGALNPMHLMTGHRANNVTLACADIVNNRLFKPVRISTLIISCLFLRLQKIIQNTTLYSFLHLNFKIFCVKLY